MNPPVSTEIHGNPPEFVKAIKYRSPLESTAGMNQTAPTGKNQPESTGIH